MGPEWIYWLDGIVVLFVVALLFALPRLQRRGLLFGVYVGEEVADGDEARAIVRSWDRQMVVWSGLGVVTTVVIAAWFGPIWASVAALAPIMVGAVISYLAAHRRAHAVAPELDPPAAVGLLDAERPRDLLLPVATLLVGVVAGLVAIAYAAVHYPEMPARIPTHFGASGAADAWSEKSWLSVMLLPFTTLGLGVILGVLTLLTARAKRALRSGGSAESQLRFRRAVTRYLATVALVAELHLLTLSVAFVRVAVGRATGLPSWLVWSTVGVVVAALVGAVYLAVRYGQGGGLAEERAGDAAEPLTDGLADDRFWKAGIFYVNRDDPSILVEKRFGLGYTINLGSPWGIGVVVGILLFTLGVMVAAFAM